MMIDTDSAPLNKRIIAPPLLAWFDQYGRHDLPWQQHPTPYRVWISEIMLQQTQVATVIPYFQLFLARFPDIFSLAHASLDAVLAQWSGLGYYARARHLHRAAQAIFQYHGGSFPMDLEALQKLPGIGRSTAGAILSLAFNQAQPILDGNVRRIFARYFAITGWPGAPMVQRQLWELATQHVPELRPGDYNQALMDLGASVCTRTRPKCEKCPLVIECCAYLHHAQSEYPYPRPHRQTPIRTTHFLLVRDPNGALLLERRPMNGVWGGLWSLPECPLATDIHHYCQTHLGLIPVTVRFQLPRLHRFTHFHLEYTPVEIRVTLTPSGISEPYLWHQLTAPLPGGIPTPVRRLLNELLASPLLDV